MINHKGATEEKLKKMALMAMPNTTSTNMPNANNKNPISQFIYVILTGR